MRSEPSRLNVLLTDGQKTWSNHLPRLLEPQGVRAIRAETVNEAMRIIESERIHVAVVDLALPLKEGADINPLTGQARQVKDTGSAADGGLKLLRVIHRLDPVPPAVVVRGRAFDRQDNRLLSEALKLDVFSVLDRPVQLEQMLSVLRRVLERYYGGSWPREATDSQS